MSNKLEHHGTAEVCDLHAHEVRVLRPTFVSYGGKPSCSGEIVTLQLEEDNRTLKALLQTPGEGRVVVVDVSGAFCAVVGDNLALHAINHGWSGMVVHGYIRDIKTLADMPIAIWALGAYPCRSEKRAEGQQDVTLKFGDVEMKSGDFLYADEDGILIADARFEDVLFAV
ncbi:MAG: ribonuclease activity A regulator [Gammaproteobacteria bacterium]|nr:MAG: ribonuclease activity A regulator [Gammaproteobacteria bacterium]